MEKTDKLSLRKALPSKIFKVVEYGGDVDIKNTNILFNTNINELKNEDILNYGRFRMTNTSNIDLFFRINNLRMIIEVKSGDVKLRDVLSEFQSGNKNITINDDVKIIGNNDYFYRDAKTYNITTINDYYINNDIKNVDNDLDKSFEFLFKTNETNKILPLITTSYDPNDVYSRFTNFFVDSVNNKIGINILGEIAYYSVTNQIVSYIDDTANIPDSKTQKTIEIFFKTDSSIENDNYMSFVTIGYDQKNNVNANFNSFYLNYKHSKIGMFNGNNFNIEFSIDRTKYFDGKYHYFVALINPDTNTLQIYLDNLLIGTHQFVNHVDYDHDETGIALGINIYDNVINFTFDGVLQNFRIFNKIFTQNEIANRYSQFLNNSQFFDLYYNISIPSNINLFDDQLHQIIITYQNNVQTFTFHIDNTNIGNIILPPNTSISSSNKGLMVGTTPIKNATQYFSGNLLIKNIYFYERILSSTEILTRFVNRFKDQYENINNSNITGSVYLVTVNNGNFIKNDTYTLYLNNNPIVVKILYNLISTTELPYTPNENDQFEILDVDRDNEGCFIKKLKTSKTLQKMLFLKN